MTWKSIRLTVVVAAMLTGAAGCATTRGRVYVRSGPPAAVVERRPAAPGPGFVWEPGYYRWSGRNYSWVPGRYEGAARARARWEPGRWVHDRHGWYFVEGRWR
ncbi:MAG: hypothetical protein ABJC89_21410 [Acidobacteriota bacterium]